MIILDIIIFLLFTFLGYLIGRWGDNYLNFWLKDPSWAPHHWIYGLVLVAFGTFYLASSLGLIAISFGIGLFISDLKDFLELKVIGPDGKSIAQRRFWHID